MTGRGTYGTGKSREGLTTHRCQKCKRRFEGTQQRGRPFRRCPRCREEKVFAVGLDEMEVRP